MIVQLLLLLRINDELFLIVSNWSLFERCFSEVSRFTPFFFCLIYIVVVLFPTLLWGR
jgi:hypothetical protein